MTRRAVEVTTGARLHFGMMSFGQPGVRQFGGVGAMIDSPGVRLRITAADTLMVTGPAAAVAQRYAEAVAQTDWFAAPPTCHIEVLAMPPAHVGLGSGTQLALAVAAGINAYFDRPAPTIKQLVQAVARSRRSAIGLYGFLFGGLIAEAGKLSPDETSPLVSRVEIPHNWRFLLVRPDRSEGLSGDAERQAFERLPAVPREATDQMCREALLGLLPAAIQARFDLFSESLYRFGQQAGSCFAPLQGGVYATPQVAATVEALCRKGAAGVAQSSWGPTVFAVLPSQDAAKQVRATIEALPDFRNSRCSIARPLNQGARIEILDG